MIVIFPLVAHCQYGYGLVIFYLEQQYITTGTKADDEFAQEWIGQRRLPATQGRDFEHRDGLMNCLQRRLGNRKVAFYPLQ